MKKQRILALLLCAILTAGALTGCGGETAPETETTQNTTPAETTETETERLTFDTTGIDYEGYEFRIWNFDNVKVNTWNPDDIPNDLYSTELNGDMLNDAVFTRNKTVEEALNIVLTVEDRDDGGLETGLRQAVVSGSQDVDVLLGGEKGLRGGGAGKPQCSSQGRPGFRGTLWVASRVPSALSTSNS